MAASLALPLLRLAAGRDGGRTGFHRHVLTLAARCGLQVFVGARARRFVVAAEWRGSRGAPREARPNHGDSSTIISVN